MTRSSFREDMAHALSGLSQEPGTIVGVYWEDNDGVHYGIPSPEQIADPDHRVIAEVTIHVAK